MGIYFIREIIFSGCPFVAFYVILSVMLRRSGGEKLIYTNLVNNVGNVYDRNTGEFTAPCDGTYKFTIGVAAAAGNQVSAQ